MIAGIIFLAIYLAFWSLPFYALGTIFYANQTGNWEPCDKFFCLITGVKYEPNNDSTT